MLNKTETQINKSIFTERPSRWMEHYNDLNSVSPGVLSDTLCYIAKELTPELLKEDQEGYKEALRIGLRGVEHESVAVRGAGLAILDRVAKQNLEYMEQNGGGKSDNVDMLIKSAEAIQDMSENDENVHLRVLASDRIPTILEKV